MQKAEESSTHDSLSGHADLPGSLDENGSHPAKDARASFADHAPIPVRFGRRLRSLRLERGLTQVQLADHLGIDRPYLSDVERGKKAMTLSYLGRVAQGFNMSLAELLNDL